MKNKAMAMTRVWLRRGVGEDLSWALQWGLWGSLVGLALGLVNRLLGF